MTLSAKDATATDVADDLKKLELSGTPAIPVDGGRRNAEQEPDEDSDDDEDEKQEGGDGASGGEYHVEGPYKMCGELINRSADAKKKKKKKKRQWAALVCHRTWFYLFIDGLINSKEEEGCCHPDGTSTSRAKQDLSQWNISGRRRGGVPVRVRHLYPCHCHSPSSLHTLGSDVVIYNIAVLPLGYPQQRRRS
jgi:hypothetical protein